jgi:hypothetical protein
MPDPSSSLKVANVYIVDKIAEEEAIEMHRTQQILDAMREYIQYIRRPSLSDFLAEPTDEWD